MTVRVRRRPGRPSGGRPVVDRELLLDAAERVIARNGSGASLEAIAVEAGVTKPIVYSRIGSRADLSNALAARLADRLLDGGGAAILSGLDRSSLAALFRSNLELLDANRELFLYVTRGTADDTPERTLYLARRSADPIADVLAGWRQRRGASAAVALPWAFGIVGMVNLVSLWWLEERDRPADVLADQLAELVWSGLSVREPDA